MAWAAAVAIAAVLLLSWSPSKAAPLTSVRFSADIPVVAAGTVVLANQVAADDLAGGVAVVPLGAIPDGVRIDGYHALSGGGHLLSFDVPVELSGLLVSPADVALHDETSFSLAFDAAGAGLPAAANVDAVTLAANGDLLLSFDAPLVAGGVYVDPRDVVRFDGTAFSLELAGSAFPRGLNLDALHLLDADTLLLSFDGSGEIGGVAFDDEDVLAYDAIADTWALAYHPTAAHPAWRAANLVALSVEAEAVLPTSTPTPGGPTPTPTATTSPGCGDGELDTSGPEPEACDDGNLIDGDGCESDCSYTPVEVVVGAGEAATTDPAGTGTSPGIPVHCEVTTPNAGTVTIRSVPPGMAPSGFALLGASFAVEAPQASAMAPLVLTFTVDSSLLPAGVGIDRLDLLRDGVVVAACAGAPGTASPDPCLTSREALPSGGAALSVLSSRASVWSVAVRGLSRREQGCSRAINAAALRLARVQAKESRRCLAQSSRGATSTLAECLAGDAAGKIEKARQRVSAVDLRRCSPPPPFGHASAATVNPAVPSEVAEIVVDLLGVDLDAAVVPSTQRPGAGCQAKTLRGLQKLGDVALRVVAACRKRALAGRGVPLAVSPRDLEACLLAIDDGVAGRRFERNRVKFEGVVARSCAAVDLGATFPGSCAGAADFSGCLVQRARCRVCRLHAVAGGLEPACDAFDDGVVNSSCE